MVCVRESGLRDVVDVHLIGSMTTQSGQRERIAGMMPCRPGVVRPSVVRPRVVRERHVCMTSEIHTRRWRRRMIMTGQNPPRTTSCQWSFQMESGGNSVAVGYFTRGEPWAEIEFGDRWEQWWRRLTTTTQNAQTENQWSSVVHALSDFKPWMTRACPPCQDLLEPIRHSGD